MTGTGWTKLYDEAQSGVVAGVPSSTYETKVVAARAHASSRLIWLDFGIQVGPQAGKVASANLYVPDPNGDGNSYRGQMFHFRKKIAGFGDLSSTFSAMPEGDTEAALTILADALVGKSTLTTLELVDKGEYAGSNSLVSTKPLGDTTPEVITVEAPEAEAAPEAPAPAESAEPVTVPEGKEVPF
jgi:hypothetical protein